MICLVLLNMKSECLKKSFGQCLSNDNVADIHDRTSKFIFEITILSGIQPTTSVINWPGKKYLMYHSQSYVTRLISNISTVLMLTNQSS